MANVDITLTELFWPGKYNEDSTLSPHCSPLELADAGRLPRRRSLC